MFLSEYEVCILDLLQVLYGHCCSTDRETSSSSFLALFWMPFALPLSLCMPSTLALHLLLFSHKAVALLHTSNTRRAYFSPHAAMGMPSHQISSPFGVYQSLIEEDHGDEKMLIVMIPIPQIRLSECRVHRASANRDACSCQTQLVLPSKLLSGCHHCGLVKQKAKVTEMSRVSIIWWHMSSEQYPLSCELLVAKGNFKLIQDACRPLHMDGGDRLGGDGYFQLYTQHFLEQNSEIIALLQFLCFLSFFSV